VDLSAWLNPGDAIVIGQSLSEPPTLVGNLIEASKTVRDLRIFCGYALAAEWSAAVDADLRITSYAAHGALRPLAGRGRVEILPCHYSELDRLVMSGQIPVDVVLLQVGAADEHGNHHLGPTVDFVRPALERARTVIVEVNEKMPRVNSDMVLHASRIDALIATERPLADTPTRPPNRAERAVACRVAELVPDGASVQLGVGALADAIARELTGHTALRIRSGLVGDWLVDLYEAGALASGPTPARTGMALGSARLNALVSNPDVVRFEGIETLLAHDAITACDPFIAINSALEVDLLGQVGAEVVAGRYVGTVGGQPDFFRAARTVRSGQAVVALASTDSSGTQSRIVPRVNGPVTTPQSGVDVVVTEHGIADLRGATYRERAARLIGIAAPQHRDRLSKELPPWV
jgi:acyl-CoA hydrolase